MSERSTGPLQGKRRREVNHSKNQEAVERTKEEVARGTTRRRPIAPVAGKAKQTAGAEIQGNAPQMEKARKTPCIWEN